MPFEIVKKPKEIAQTSTQNRKIHNIVKNGPKIVNPATHAQYIMNRSCFTTICFLLYG